MLLTVVFLEQSVDLLLFRQSAEAVSFGMLSEREREESKFLPGIFDGHLLLEPWFWTVSTVCRE